MTEHRWNSAVPQDTSNTATTSGAQGRASSWSGFIQEISSCLIWVHFRNDSQLQVGSEPCLLSVCILLGADKRCCREHIGIHNLPSSLLCFPSKATASSSPAASSTACRLARQEKVSHMLFSCAPEKRIICPTNLVIYWTDKPESCEPPQNQVGYVPAIVLHNTARFIFLFKTTLYRRQMKSWNNRIPHCSQHSSLLAKLFR